MKTLIARLFKIAWIENVINAERKFGSSKSYYRVTCYTMGDEGLEEVRLLMTANEFYSISRRALNNEEEFE